MDVFGMKRGNGSDEALRRERSGADAQRLQLGRQCLAELFAGIMQAIPSIPSL